MTGVSTEIHPMLKHQECVPEAITSILANTCGLTLSPVAPQEAADEVILAVISLVGDLEWTLFLALPPATAAGVASKFAGFDVPQDSPDLADAIGEVANIFAGEVKALLDKRGVRVELSLPSVLRGSKLQMMIPREAPYVRSAFECPLGRLDAGVIVGKKSLANG